MKYQILKWRPCEVFFGALIPFWDLFFDLRRSWRSWPPDINNLWRSKYEINEKISCKVSNHRFLGVLIPLWEPFFDLRRSWRLWPPDPNNLWRSKYEINERISCKVSNYRFFGVQIPFWPQMIMEVWPPNINDLQSSKDENNKANILHSIFFLMSGICTTSRFPLNFLKKLKLKGYVKTSLLFNSFNHLKETTNQF